MRVGVNQGSAYDLHLTHTTLVRGEDGTTRDRAPDAVRYRSEVVEELKASGFVADVLRRAGQAGDLVAPA